MSIFISDYVQFSLPESHTAGDSTHTFWRRKNENIALAFIKNFNALYLVFLSMKTPHVSWYFIILTHEKTEAQRGCVTCLKSHILVMVDPGS